MKETKVQYGKQRQVRFSPAELAMVKPIQDRYGFSFSAAVRFIVREFLATNQAK